MDYATTEQMNQLKAMAATRVHRLAPHMVGETANQRPLAMPAYQRVMANLTACPLKPGAGRVSADHATATESESVTIVPEPPAERDPSWPRWLQVGEGIYFHEGDVYRVYQSKYPPHYWMCKILNKDKAALDQGEPRWAKVNGVIAKLRPAHEMTAEQSIRFEADYGITVCTICGAELENDESIRIRKGPVCRNK